MHRNVNNIYKFTAQIEKHFKSNWILDRKLNMKNRKGSKNEKEIVGKKTYHKKITELK